jgi:hypothetical protein
MRNELVGYQGRATNDEISPRYFSCPNTSKTRMLYNFDVASRQAHVVVVEGARSVWRIGASAVCTFGKTLSLYQQGDAGDDVGRQTGQCLCWTTTPSPSWIKARKSCGLAASTFDRF